MSTIQLQNEFITVGINQNGAEMCSLVSKKTNREYMWVADSNYWGRHAPVLFPIVGQVQNGEYHIGDDAYQLSQHGFARDMMFEVESQSDSEVTLLLKSNDQTKEKYPYQFELRIIYKIDGNKATVGYQVTNTDNDTIWFSIGAHPGFNCPFVDGETFGEYVLEFEKPETADKLNFAEGLLAGTSTPCLNSEKEIALSHDLFNEDAIIFKTLESDYVDFKSKSGGEFMRFSFEGFPFFAIWSPPGKEAPFVCLEPWFGITDTYNLGLDYREKQGIQKLEVGESFSSEYGMSIIG